MKHSAQILTLLIAFGTCACAEEDKRVTSVIPGKSNEYMSIRVFDSGLHQERQYIVVERFANNGVFSDPTVSYITTLYFQNSIGPDAASKLLEDFSFDWQTSDSLIIRSSYVGKHFVIPSKGKCGFIDTRRSGR